MTQPGTGGPTVGGGKTAAKIADHLARTVTHSIQAMTPHKRKLGALVLEDFFDKVSGEIRETTGDLFGPLADHEAMPPQLRGVFGFLARGNGQWQTFLGQTVAGTAIGGGLLNLLSNLLNPVVLPLIAADPHGFLSPADAASAVARGHTHGRDMAWEAAKSGIDRTAFDVLVDLSHAELPAGAIVEGVNRGTIDPAFAQTLLRQAGYTPTAAGLILDARHMELTPQELATLVNFGVLSEQEATPLALRSGIRQDDFHRLVLGNGAAPSATDLMFAFRRGFIDQARLARGLQQGPLRAEWFDVIEHLTSVPMSTADAIEAAVQSHLSIDQAKKIASQNGLIPEHFQPLYDTAGSPPGPEKMLDLLNRGLVTEAETIQALSESRLKNKYIPLLLQSRHRIPPERSIISMVSKGVITPQEGQRYLEQLGFSPQLAAALIAEAHATVAQKTKDLSVAQVEELFLDKAITRSQAVDRLAALGYPAVAAGELLDLVEHRRAQRQLGAVITKLHREYVARLLSEQEVRNYLGRLAVPPDQVAVYLDLWAVERDSVRRQLTESQVGQALKKGFMSAEQASERWSAMGYPDADVAILAALHAPPAPTGG